MPWTPAQPHFTKQQHQLAVKHLIPNIFTYDDKITHVGPLNPGRSQSHCRQGRVEYESVDGRVKAVC